MVLDMDMDFQHMESDPRDGHIEPRSNLHQIHHHRGRSHDHSSRLQPVDTDLDLELDLDLDLDLDLRHQVLDYRPQHHHHPQQHQQHIHNPDSTTPSSHLHHPEADYHEQSQNHNHNHNHDHRYSLPPASYAAANHESIAANAHHAFTPVNPDDFYQSYRALHLANNPDILPMATSVPRPSLRSNGDGTTPKHPVVSSNRALRTNIRSTSNPVDNRPPGLPYTPSTSPGHPSVRDLKKRFDQNGGSTSIPRAPTHLSSSARSHRDGGPSAQPRSNATSYSTLRAGAAQDSSTDLSNSSTSPRPQRAKFVAEDQISSNSQSFASRIGKPRSSASENPNASKAMTNLPPKSPPPQQPQISTSPTSSRAQGLLFGEVLPEQHNISIAGYGIDSVRERRTSESGLHHHPWSHQRSLSDPDAEPSSPTSWYRSLNNREGIEGQTQPDPAQKGHSRSQSDVPTSRSALPVVRKPASRRPPSSNGSVSGSTSKLPRSVRKLSSPTGSESASSTRSSSPSNFRRPRTNGRTSRTGPSMNRAKTPVSQPKSSANTPNSRKGAPRALVTPSSSNNRLQANIIAPPPKLSPPLRSSRPRQPVSMATTASSRSKAVDRARSPNPLSQPPTKIAEPSTRRRKISVGPIDFEQRREHIRLAYTKSIRESQALEARQNATDRRRKEMEAAAKAKAVAAAAVAAGSASEHDAYNADGDHGAISNSHFHADSAEVSPTHDVPPVPAIPAIHNIYSVQESPANSRVTSTSGLHILGGDGNGREQEARADIFDEPSPAPSSIIAADVAAALPPIALSAAFDSQLDSPTTESASIVFESPTLGVPGSFPTHSPSIDTRMRPSTALSATSDATEFEDEPQTNSPVRAQSPLEVPITIVKPPTPHTIKDHHTRIEYTYPFEEEPDSPARLETSQNTIQEIYEPALMQAEVESPTIPGAFNDELYSDHAIRSEAQSPFETTITILPPPDDHRPKDRVNESIPFPRIESNYESDFNSEIENDHELELHRHHESHETTDACTEGTDEHHRTDDCRSELHYDDQLSSHRASTCESSDAGVGDELHYSNYDQQSIPGTTRSLTVPQFRAADRFSQQSAWTDFSIESGDFSDNNRSPMLQDDEDDGSAPLGHATIFETRSIHRESRLPSRPRELQHSQSEVRPSMDSSRSFNLFGNHHLPELNTGDDFTIPYLSQRATKSFTYVPSPNHEPPPIPTPGSGSVCNSQRASAVFYDQSQYGSTLINSERGSEEYVPSMTTPHSVDTASGGTPEQYFPSTTVVDNEAKVEVTDKNEPSAKEKGRLVQRRNVIKELIDTEAVFVRDMSIVEEIYKGTAEACPQLDGTTSKLVFRNTDEIIEFHASFLIQLKEAVVSVYAPQIRRSALSREGSFMSDGQFGAGELDDDKDRATAIGPVFQANIEKMKLAHEGFLRNSDQAAKRLIQIQQDPTVKVWLNECNEVAKDLTAAWDLDSLLIKPMQRITKYPNLIITLLGHTPADHPDREALVAVKDSLETAIIEINKTKKNFELVGQIVGRKRKESDVKAGFARAFGKRVDKLQASGNRPPEDPEYAKLNEKFGDDYLRLQVVLRDVEFYTRQVSAYVHEFLQYLSSIELVMRIQPGSYPELESKWVQFNISIRDLEKVALEDHLSQVRKHVIEPFELVIKAYGNPSLAMKKREKRRVDFERYEQLKRGGKNADTKLKENVEQYEALNDTLKKELPKLSSLTEKVGNICLGNFVNIQVKWYGIWKDKMKVVLGDTPDIPDLKEVVSTFQRDFPYAQEQIANIGILNPDYRGRMSQSTTASVDESLLKVRSRPTDIDPIRARGLSLNGDQVPILPVPDFTQRNSGSFTMSPTSMGPGNAGPAMPSPHHYYYRDYYNGLGNPSQGNASPMSPDMPGSSRSFAASTRPSTGRSFDSGGMPRQSSDSTTHPPRDSNTTYSSTYNTPQQQEARRFSGLFHSALPLPDGPEESQRSSRASSRERGPAMDGYNILWLAASLFEFNIATTKHEAGYPYLIYQAGEIFDVIAEKGELWLAKNQDDPSDQVGWIWSKHFAKLADA